MAGPALAGPLPAPGCLAGGEPATVRSASAALEPILVDGTVVKLAGIDPVGAEAPDTAGRARTALTRWLSGRSVMLRTLGSGRDRWDRRVALAFVPADAPPPPSPAPEAFLLSVNGTAPASAPASSAAGVSLGEALLDAGFARARPDPLVAPCWAGYLALEADARRNRLGLWAEPADAVIAAEDEAALARATGRLAVVEGRILHDRAGPARHLLVFTDRGRDGFAIAIGRTDEKRLFPAEDLASWIGRRVRVRGFLDDRFGFQIDLTSRDQVQFIDP